MNRLFLCIVCTMLPLFGADAASQAYRFKNSVDNSDAVVSYNKEITFNYTCAESPDKNIKTEIIGYDFENGLVKCRVRDITKDTYDTHRSTSADKQYTKKNFLYQKEKFVRDINKKIKDEIAKQANKNEQVKDNTQSDLSIFLFGEQIKTETSVDGAINLSHYLSGLATLQNISPDKTVGTTEEYKFSEKLGIAGLDTKVDFKIAQAMNQANIEYFKELYYGMNSVYTHLQNLLFIVVGGFFLATLGGQKIQKYLENRGQSTGQKEPYLHKFFIPLLCAGVFYMPITDSGGVNNTIIQNIIRYFTNEATTIADAASRIGLQAYTKRFDKEHNIRNQLGQQEQINIDKNLLLYHHITNFYIPVIKNELDKCTKDYDDTVQFFEEVNEDWLAREAKNNLNKQWFTNLSWDKIKRLVFSNKETDFPSISLDACKYLAKEYTRYITASRVLEKKYDGIESKANKQGIIEDAVKKNIPSDSKKRLENTSEKVFTILKRNETEYGWLNSVIAPASVILLGLQADAKKNAQFNSKEDITKMLDEKKIATMGSLGEKADEESLTTSFINFALDKVVVFMLPGSKSIYDMITQSGSVMRTAATFYVGYSLVERGATKAEIIANAAVALVGASSGAIENLSEGASNVIKRLPFLGLEKLLALPFDATSSVAGSLNNLAAIYLGVATVYFLYMDILEKLPLIIVSISGILAFITYFVSLCKYYYISPFVVAFALTTKRVDKIINFLIIGITIFFKPVLIVLFIYLALFLYGIVYELFIITSVSQFNSIMASSFENSINFGTQLTIGIIKTLLQFFGSLGSCYIVWKTIMTGPDWVFKMLGLETSATSEATQQLAGKLEQKAVVI